ncbi:MAG: DUF4335 domain-containing protein [Coleofasciculaceae cyanobacterium]
MTMLFSNSVLRRYTPPTCTLEIVAKTSPLSRWAGTSVLRNLRFELRLDDPRQSEDRQITIKGNRTDLEILSEAVNSYVQEFLNQSSGLMLAAERKAPTHADSISDNQASQGATALTTSEGTDLETSANPASKLEADQTKDSSLAGRLEIYSQIIISQAKPQTTPIYLQPRGLLAHNLFLGQLANEKSGPVVDLSALQLFDLATVLDKYATELIEIPTLNQLSGKKVLPAWTKIAAAVLLTVGLTTAGAKLFYSSETNQEASTPGESSQTEETPVVASIEPSPSPPVILAPSPIPTPVVPTPLATPPTLLPPSPVQIPSQPLPSELPPIASNSGSNPPQVSLDIQPPPATSNPFPLIGGGQYKSSLPQVPRESVSSTPSDHNQPQKSIKIPAAPPPLPELPSLQQTRSSPDREEVEIISSPSPELVSSNSDLSSSENPGQNSTLDDLKQLQPTPDRPIARETTSTKIPQMTEVQDYVQQRWEPPSNLTQTLEYSLFLNTDGSIQRIIPLGNAAQEYLGSLKLPSVGQPFVSEMEGVDNPKIRLVLSPDGKIDTFLQSTN